MTDGSARDDLGALLASARSRLAGAPRIRLGELREPGRIRRAFGGREAIVPAASAWHLGVLLVGDERLWATGTILRASEEVRRGFTAESQRERAAVRGMAFRGGFAEGEPFHTGGGEIDVAAVAGGSPGGPLSWRGGRLMVSWSPAGFLMPLADYLDERIGLALAPAD